MSCSDIPITKESFKCRDLPESNLKIFIKRVKIPRKLKKRLKNIVNKGTGRSWIKAAEKLYGSEMYLQRNGYIYELVI